MKKIFLAIIVTISAIWLNINQIHAFNIKDLTKNIEYIYNEDTIINPAYIQYIELSDEEKANVDLIPEPFLFVFTPTEPIDGIVYPTKYNLRDYGYVTAVKNQGSSGLCWSYTMTTIIESTAKKKGINLSLSPKYYDYFTVLPTNYIDEAINPYYNSKSLAYDSYLYFHNPNRLLLGGGNSLYYENLLAAGFTPGSTTTFGDYTPTYSSKLSLEKMFSKTYSDYVVTEAYDYPTVYNTEDKEIWIDMIKNHIMNYGPLYVSTYSPDSRSGACYNSAYNMVDYKSTRCPSIDTGHAMTIIGWDNNYGPNNEGAWILQNSWGTSNQFPYLSFNSDINGIYGIKTVEKKSYDNSYDYLSISNYQLVTSINNKYIGNIQTHKFVKSSDTEVLKYLTFTFNSSAQNQKFEVYISTTGKVEDLKLVGTVDSPYNGIAKFSTNNLVLENDNFLVGLRRTNGSYVSWYNLNAFTSNAEKNTATFDAYMENSSHLKDKNEVFSSYLTTFINYKNNKTIDTLNYNIFNSNNQNVKSLFTLQTNYNNFKNYIINGKSILKLAYSPSSVPAGWYTLNVQADSNISSLMFDISFLTNYTVYERKNGYMYLDEDTTKTTFLNGIKTLSGTTTKIYDSTNNEITPTIMGTGMILRLINNGETVDYTTVISGDVDGDGYVDAYDVLLMKRYGVGSINLNEAYFEAGDIDKDKLLDAYDVLLVRRYIVGLGEL